MVQPDGHCIIWNIGQSRANYNPRRRNELKITEFIIKNIYKHYGMRAGKYDFRERK